MAIIDAADIKARVNIEEIIGEYAELRPKGRNSWALCPFHAEKTPSFSVNPDKQMFYCFGCNTGGDVFTFVMKYHDIDYKEARDVLAARAGIEVGTMNRADYQRIQAARRRREQEKELADKLQSIIDAEVNRLIFFEKWTHRIIGLIQSPETLDIPVIAWAIKNQDIVSYFLDDLLQTDDSAKQLDIVYLSKEAVQWNY